MSFNRPFLQEEVEFDVPCATCFSAALEYCDTGRAGTLFYDVSDLIERQYSRFPDSKERGSHQSQNSCLDFLVCPR
jgi:hypothetical protein